MRATIRKSALEGLVLFAVTLLVLLLVLLFVAVDVASAGPQFDDVEPTYSYCQVIMGLREHLTGMIGC